MRTLEIFLVITTLIRTSLHVFGKKINRQTSRMTTLTVFLCLISHIILEGLRWQMSLIYLVAYAQIVYFFWDHQDNSTQRSKRWRTAGIIIAIVFIAISSGFSTLLPIFKLPQPTGPYAIGTVHYYYIDPDRKETFTPNPDDHREVPFQIWYPAEFDNTAQPMPYLEPDASKRFSEGANLPAFMFDYMKFIQTHTNEGAQIAENGAPFPILIFNPGYGGAPRLYLSIIEHLVSHGYVLVGIPHVDSGSFYTLPDGSVQVSSIDNSPFHEEAFGERVEFIKGNLTHSRTVTESEFWYQQLIKNSPVNQASIHAWAEDVRFVIDKLYEFNENGSDFTGHLNLEQIGVFGHSFGGATSAQALISDDRISAGVNIDGFQYGDLLETPLNKPFMFITAEHASEGIPFPSKTNLVYFSQADAEIFNLFIKGTEHHSFTDIPLWGKLLSDARYTDTDPGECLFLVQEYLLTFFDTYVKNHPTESKSVLTLSHPEVVIEHHIPQTSP